MTNRVAILGAGGRMGAAITRCIQDGRVPGLQLAGAVDRDGHPGLGADVGALSGTTPAGVLLTNDAAAVVPNIDVAIDFSAPESTAAHAALAAAAGKALVIGTTGLAADQHASVSRASGSIPIVMAPNMSLGINLLLALARQAATSLRGKGYDVEIIERHHRLKKDAPSGTALGLGKAVAAGLDIDLDEASRHGREGVPGERTADEIGFHAVRAGDFVGDHTVLFATDGESVELSHRATSRDTFATGALRAAAWVCGREPGLYSMRDVLGL